MRNASKLLSLSAAISATVLLLAGCTALSTSGVTGSRSVIYESVDQMLGDSSTVVVVTVLSQTQEGERSQSQTVSTVQVEQSLTPAALAASDKFVPISVASGDRIIVRQIGTKDLQEVPAPFLSVGSQYLLFLTPTMLEGKLASQFFVTGVSAGIYELGATDSAKPGEFVSLATEGDNVPETINPATLK